MNGLFARVYIDYGSVVREIVMRDEEVSYYINHNKVDLKTFKKVIDNDLPECATVLQELVEKEEDETFVSVTPHQGIAHLYNGGTAYIVDTNGNPILIEPNTFMIDEVAQYANPTCDWFVPVKEYKK